MTSKLVPANPEEVMVIRDVVPNVTTLSVPFLRFGHIKVGGRGTIVRLSTGSLAVFSPVALTETVKSKLASISPAPPTVYLIAPDIEHHIFLSTWAEYFPQNHVIGPEGLAEKRAEQNKTDKAVTILDFKTIFTAKGKEDIKVSPEFDAEFEYEFVDAHMNKELAFFHKPSKILIEADLMFNLPATEQYSKTGQVATSGFLTSLFVGLNNTSGTAIWQQRLIWYGTSSSDRTGFGASIKKINGWDFEHIIPCHGDVISSNAKEIFAKVFAWFLNGKH